MTGPVIVTRHSDERSSWEMAHREPGPELPGVITYCGYRERSNEPFARLEVPSGRVAVILSFGDPIDVSGSARTSFVAGINETPAVTCFDGSQYGIQVDVTPQTARMLFGIPQSELSSQLVVDAEHLLWRPELIERLEEAQGWSARFELLDRELARRLAEAEPASREVGWAFGRLRATHGGIPVGSLAVELGWSARRLITRFRDQVGLPPKSVARILRFERVTDRLRAGDALADVAYDAGYFDQAHLNRDFREFARCTPTEWMARQLPGQGGTAASP